MPWKRSSRSEIVHIVVTGYQKKKEPSKHYVFVIDITWNNSERYEVYRRYSDFFSFQTTLKALFPAAAGRKNDARVIPQLPKRIFVGRSHVAKVAEARLEQLNRYCQTLISLEPLISESVHVIGFFSPRSTDKPLPKLHLHRPASIHPQNVPAGSLFEEYCALAEYEAEDDSQISFKPGDKVLVLSKDESGWWMCNVDGDKVGWAPPSYLKKCEKCDGESDSDDEYIGLPETYAKGKDSDDSGVGDHESTPNSSAVQGFSVPEIVAEEYRAIDSYEAEGAGQVSFEAGSTVHVLDKMEDGWWFVSNGVDEGWAPCSYLENVNGDDADEYVNASSLDIQKYVSLEKYTAEEDDELSFAKGVTVDVLQKRLDGWWLIRLHSKIGLAPATFLQKLANSHPLNESGEEPLFRKVVIQPAQSQSPEFTITNKQPPRKQSVRYRASLKKNALAKSQSKPEYSNLLSPLPHTQATPITTSIPEAVNESPTKSPAREQLSAPIPAPRSSSPRQASPISSDSEPETNAKTKPPKSPRMVKRGLESRIRKFEKRRESVSSSDSNPTTPTKPQQMKTISVPDTRKSPNVNSEKKSLPAEEVPDKRPTPPPRPHRGELNRLVPVVPKIKEELADDSSSTASFPNRPARPRPSEIRKAKERFRANKDGGDADVSSVFSHGSKSSSDVSSRTAHSKAQKKQSTPEFSTSSLLPPPPAVPRRKSAGDVNIAEAVPPPLCAPPERPNTAITSPAANPLNQQMADTLIKYILASEDQGLKQALRQIITSDPQVMEAIQDDKKAPPHRQ